VAYARQRNKRERDQHPGSGGMSISIIGLMIHRPDRMINTSYRLIYALIAMPSAYISTLPQTGIKCKNRS
jgi:hypothetical protein